MYCVYTKVVDGDGGITYQNTKVESLVDGVAILEEIMEDITNSDSLLVEFKIISEN